MKSMSLALATHKPQELAMVEAAQKPRRLAKAKRSLQVRRLPLKPTNNITLLSSTRQAQPHCSEGFYNGLRNIANPDGLSTLKVQVRLCPVIRATCT